jgi:hypothetical protein
MKALKLVGVSLIAAVALSAPGTASAIKKNRCVTAGQTLFTTVNYAPMRSAPNPKAGLIIRITPKSSAVTADQSCPTKFVTPKGATQTWYNVTFFRFTGWVVSGQLRE